MTIVDAFQRLGWRFSNGKFEPNQKDLDALKFILDWVNRAKETELQANTIFAKMYVYCFKHELQFYKDLGFAQKKLHEVLEQPLPDLYDEFSKSLNNFELECFMKSKGLDREWVSDEKTKEQQDMIAESQTEIKKLFIGKWDSEKVTKSLNNQITEAINRYKNLP